MEVSHSHTFNLQLTIFQRHTYDNIEVEVEEGGSQHTALTETTSDGKLTWRPPIGPDSSTLVIMHGMNDGDIFGGKNVSALKQGPESFMVHRITGFSRVNEADLNWPVKLPCFLHHDPQREELVRKISTMMKAILALTEKEFCTWFEQVEDYFHNDLARDVHKTNAQIVIADCMTSLLLERISSFPPVAGYCFLQSLSTASSSRSVLFLQLLGTASSSRSELLPLVARFCFL